MLLSRIRCHNCDQRCHLFTRQLSENDLCTLCNKPETIYYFFIQCPNYSRLRSDCVKQIPLECFNLETQLHGSIIYSETLNILIQEVCQKILIASGRLPRLYASAWHHIILPTFAYRDPVPHRLGLLPGLL